ncbi:hypothetical protein B296_00002619 [Ensete ventricosum]|uniref:Uncharacterized protein n=1 Tax=Ensete ventricosum TaxID=4639 RepID=A0A427ATA9_ENSVE|nr:hypothetical protein B296_00002619 [Ensete ventricosum]
MTVITVEATISPLVLLLPAGLHRVGRPEEPLFSYLKENFGLSGIGGNLGSDSLGLSTLLLKGPECWPHDDSVEAPGRVVEPRHRVVMRPRASLWGFPQQLRNMGDDHLDYPGQGLHLIGEPKEGLERGDGELGVECWRGKSWIVEQLLIMTRSIRQRISFPGGEGERLSSGPRDMLGDMDFFPRVARQ